MSSKTPSDDKSHYFPQLRIPFCEAQPAIDTRWIALAGGPCSGKSTMSEILSQRFSWPIMPDYAREIYEEAFERGKTHGYLEDNVAYFQRRICTARLNFCYEADKAKVHLFDYGLPCDFAWHRYWKLKVNANLRAACEQLRYKTVFLLEPLPMKHDAVRRDSIKRQQALYRQMQKAYKAFGYEVIDVPIFSDIPEKSIQRRLTFMTDHLAQAGILRPQRAAFGLSAQNIGTPEKSRAA